MQKGKNKFTCFLLFGYYFFRNKCQNTLWKVFLFLLVFPLSLKNELKNLDESIENIQKN